MSVSWSYRLSVFGFSLCLISLPTYLFLFGTKEREATTLRALVQKTPTFETLSPRFFSDYLRLSPQGRLLIIKKIDQVTIQKKLLEFPVFKSIVSDVTSEGDLIVSYELRRPLFRVHDYKNCGLDEEGYIIPLAPFYSPKTLPSVYLGLKELSWIKACDMQQVQQVLKFFNQKAQEPFQLKLIDISKLIASRSCHREVVVVVSVFDQDHYLRLNPLFIEKALKRYVRLFEEPKLESELKASVIFDARISKFATLKKVS